MKAKKKFGQHFLSNENYIKEISALICSLNKECKTLIEVGPGQGAITQHIYSEFENFYAIEIDPEAIITVKNNIPEITDNIVEADFLKVNMADIVKDNPFVLSGNYPYNISSQIIFKMIDLKHQIPFMVGMFQKEVAERIVSKPNSKVYGILSVLTQLYYKGHIVFDLEPEAFEPPPKVYSSVIYLERHENYAYFKDEKLFKSVVKQSFNQRRKMIRNTLKSFFLNKSILEEEIFTKRPEHLSVEDFIYICELIKKDKDES